MILEFPPGTGRLGMTVRRIRLMIASLIRAQAGDGGTRRQKIAPWRTAWHHDRLRGPRPAGVLLERCAGHPGHQRARRRRRLGHRRFTPGSPAADLPASAGAETGKVRLHLDIQVDDIGAARQQVENLGGCWSGERHDYDDGIVMVMRDLENHEFCLVQFHDISPA
jgi:hypothetical protein